MVLTIPLRCFWSSSHSIFRTSWRNSFFQDGKLRMESAGREFPFKGRGIGAVASAPKPLPFAPSPRPADKAAAAAPVKHIPAPRVELPRRLAACTGVYTRCAARLFLEYWEVLAAMVLVLARRVCSGGSIREATIRMARTSPRSPLSPLRLPRVSDVKPDAGVWHVT